VVKTGQTDEGYRGDIQYASLIAGISCLTDVKEISQLFLTQVGVLPQVSYALIHDRSPQK